MDTNELKFLLKLLGFPNYRAGLSAFSSFKGRDKVCRELGDRELVDYSREIATVKILPAGQALLELEPGQLPITDKEIKVLEKISKSTDKLAPSKITSLKAAERDAILKTLSERGLIETELQRKKNGSEVWLTERGIEELRDDYNPNKSSNPVISQELLGNYLRFLRKTLPMKSQPINDTLHPATNESSSEAINHIDDEEILHIIKKLDEELGTENYLPIFHLRQKLQPPLSRNELDQALYRLEESSQIELSSLSEPRDYAPEQVDAGIVQIGGSSLFFITVN